jgi:acetyltransferase-like isoleucine patch superfamily enzyme
MVSHALTPHDSTPSLSTSQPMWPRFMMLKRRAAWLKYYKWESLPWNRLWLSIKFLRRDAFARGPLYGNSLRMLREERLQIGRGLVIEANVTISADTGQVHLGKEIYISRGATIGAVQLVEIGDYCLVGPGCYITDADHRFDDHETPVPLQGMCSRGPTIIEDNVWLGANVVVTSGVRIGRRSVIGANSVVTRDIPPYSMAAGSPATVQAPIHEPTLAGSRKARRVQAVAS